GGGASIGTHRPDETAASDAGSTAPSDDVTSRPAVGDGGASSPTLDQDAAAPTTDQPLPDGDSEPPLSWDGTPDYSNYVRLTHQQWENSVVANLRLDAPTGFLTKLSPDPYLRYSNNEETLRVGDTLLAEYQVAAANIAARVTADANALRKVSAASEPEAFIAEVGRRFYRRPLTSAEQATYLALYETGAGLASVGQDEFAAGVQLL